MNITRFIPYGREIAISRAELARTVGTSDRKVRDTVRDYRSEWKPIEPFICSDSSERGYWLTRDPVEIRLFRDWYKSYTDSSGQVLNNIDRGLAKLDGTGLVYVRAHYRHISNTGRT